MSRESFVKDCHLREGFLEGLEKEAHGRHAAGNKTPVLFSFVTDAYQPIETGLYAMRQAIQILHRYDIGVIILTKGGERSMRDFDLLEPDKDQYAVTLTCLDDDESLKWEPYAALPAARIKALKEASLLGIETWVSLEPVLSPAVAYRIIDEVDQIAGHFKVGPLNYDPHAGTIDWADFARGVTACLDEHRSRYYIKKDLAGYLGKNEGYWSHGGSTVAWLKERFPRLYFPKRPRMI